MAKVTTPTNEIANTAKASSPDGRQQVAPEAANEWVWDIASWVIVPFYAGLFIWFYIHGALKYGHARAPGSLVAVGGVIGVMTPFVVFGICWFVLRAGKGKLAWWRALVTAHPIQAYVVCGLGPASIFAGYWSGAWLLMLFNHLGK
jgi:hypothetical protein